MNKKINIYIIIGILFLTISFSLNMYNVYENKKAGIESKKTYNQILETFKEEFDEEVDEEKIVNIDGNNYIGIINIPSINIELPIMNDWSNEKMKISSCKYYGSIYTNDLVLCAHAYENLFKNIKKLKQSDIVILTDMNQNEYLYEVKVIETLSPYDVEEMIENEFDLTLFTCTDDNLNRITVRLNRI